MSYSRESMTVRYCSEEAYPRHWIPTVTVWTCNGCGIEVTIKGHSFDKIPEGWWRTLEKQRRIHFVFDNSKESLIWEGPLHVCSTRCMDEVGQTISWIQMRDGYPYVLSPMFNI